jgi:hypothetical protein
MLRTSFHSGCQRNLERLLAPSDQSHWPDAQPTRVRSCTVYWTRGYFQVQHPNQTSKSFAIISPRKIFEDSSWRTNGVAWTRMLYSTFPLWARYPTRRWRGRNRKEVINPKARKISLIPNLSSYGPHLASKRFRFDVRDPSKGGVHRILLGYSMAYSFYIF